MHRTDADGNVANAFDDGNPATGTPGTKVEETWLNAVQEEIANTIEAGGVVLAKETNTQLSQVVAPLAIGFGAADLGTTSARWLFPWYEEATIDATRRVIPVPMAGKIRAIYVHAVTAFIGAGGAYTFTVFKNGVVTSLAAGLSEGAFDASDTGAVDVAAGDYLEIFVECAGVTTSAKRVTATIALMLG